MMCKRISAFLIGALLTAGCAKKAVMSVDRAEATYANVSGLAGPSSAMYSFVGLVSDNSHRFVAVRHKLEILSSESNLSKSWESVMSVDRAEATYANVSGLAGPSSAMNSFVGLVSDNSHRFVAVRHKLEILSS